MARRARFIGSRHPDPAPDRIPADRIRRSLLGTDDGMGGWATIIQGMYRDLISELAAYVLHAKNDLGWSKAQTRAKLLLHSVPTHLVDEVLIHAYKKED